MYNLTTYPHLVSFLDALGVDTQPSDMSFSLSMDGGRLEWASHDLDSVFAQRKNMASPSFLMMLRDVVRFGKEAPKVMQRGGEGEKEDSRGVGVGVIVCQLDTLATGLALGQHRAMCSHKYTQTPGGNAAQAGAFSHRQPSIMSASRPSRREAHHSPLTVLPCAHAPALPWPGAGPCVRPRVSRHDAGAVPQGGAVQPRLHLQLRTAHVRSSVERAQRTGKAAQGL